MYFKTAIHFRNQITRGLNKPYGIGRNVFRNVKPATDAGDRSYYVSPGFHVGQGTHNDDQIKPFATLTHIHNLAQVRASKINIGKALSRFGNRVSRTIQGDYFVVPLL